MRSGVSELFPELIGSRQSPSVLSSFLHRSRTEAPSLHRHDPASPVLRASPPPCPARPVPRGMPVGTCTPPTGLPVLPPSPSGTHAAANTPAETPGARVARFPDAGCLPRYSGGSASALCFSRPARRSLALRPLMLETVASTAQTGRNSGQGARHSATLSSPAWLGARGLDGPGRGGGVQREAVVTSVAGSSTPERGVARCWAAAGAASCGRRTAPRRQLPASSARSAAGLDQCPPASRRGSAARLGRASRRAAGRVASAWNEGSSRSWTARRSASCQTCTEDRNGIASKRLGEAGSTTRPWPEDTRRIAL